MDINLLSKRHDVRRLGINDVDIYYIVGLIENSFTKVEK